MTSAAHDDMPRTPDFELAIEDDIDEVIIEALSPELGSEALASDRIASSPITALTSSPVAAPSAPIHRFEPKVLDFNGFFAANSTTSRDVKDDDQLPMAEIDWTGQVPPKAPKKNIHPASAKIAALEEENRALVEENRALEEEKHALVEQNKLLEELAILRGQLVRVSNDLTKATEKNGNLAEKVRLLREAKREIIGQVQLEVNEVRAHIVMKERYARPEETREQIYHQDIYDMFTSIHSQVSMINRIESAFRSIQRAEEILQANEAEIPHLEAAIAATREEAPSVDVHPEPETPPPSKPLVRRFASRRGVRLASTPPSQKWIKRSSARTSQLGRTRSGLRFVTSI